MRIRNPAIGSMRQQTAVRYVAVSRCANYATPTHEYTTAIGITCKESGERHVLRRVTHASTSVRASFYFGRNHTRLLKPTQSVSMYCAKY